MPDRSVSKWIKTWIWRIHIYIGLYLLLFMLLFFISGFLLNHTNWKFAQYWTKREESTFERSIKLPTETGDLARAKNIMRQLGFSGEITVINTLPGEGQFNFGILKPGKNVQIKTDLNTGRVSVKEIRTNIFGVLHAMHILTGVRGNNPKQQRDWIVTRIWSFSMDAVSLGLIFLVFSSVYLWYQHKKNRLLGVIVLGLGIFCCGFFLFGLSWMN